jgi:uncharacterized protein (TIGR00297 family)
MFLSIILLTTLIQVIPYIVCAGLCLLACRMRWLTWAGATAAFLMSLVFLQSSTELKSVMNTFYLPLLLLIGGTLLSKLNKTSDEKHGRNLKQVLANGGIGTVCLLLALLWPKNYMVSVLFLMAYMVSFSVSICDTFSSEVGTFFKGETVDILRFKRVKPGLSGGISVAGTLAGLGAAMCCVLIMMGGFGIQFRLAAGLAAWGFSGMLLDSVLGSLLQAKYINREGVIAEQPADGFKLYKGFSWCTNDAVNVLSNLIVVVIFMLMNVNLFF